jgi:hypothetical protein
MNSLPINKRKAILAVVILVLLGCTSGWGYSRMPAAQSDPPEMQTMEKWPVPFGGSGPERQMVAGVLTDSR